MSLLNNDLQRKMDSVVAAFEGSGLFEQRTVVREKYRRNAELLAFRFGSETIR
jgi:hypothetical protein